MESVLILFIRPHRQSAANGASKRATAAADKAADKATAATDKAAETARKAACGGNCD